MISPNSTIYSQTKVSARKFKHFVVLGEFSYDAWGTADGDLDEAAAGGENFVEADEKIENVDEKGDVAQVEVMQTSVLT